MRVDSAASTLVVPVLCTDSGHALCAVNWAQHYQFGWSQFCAQILGTFFGPKPGTKMGLNMGTYMRSFFGNKNGTTKYDDRQRAFRLLDPFF